MRPRDRRTGVAFGGFAPDALQFWHELAAEMSKDWFAANKLRYQTVWVEPALALLREVARGLSPAYKPFALAEPGALRIYRDLRFSRDKTPYKTHIAAIIRLAGDRVAEAGHAALYLHLGDDGEYAGVGCYQFDAARFARWRRAVVGAPGAALLQLIARLRKKGYQVGGYEYYARVPKGFAPDHPRADLLKYKGLVCQFPPIPVGLLHRPEFARWLLRHAQTAAPPAPQGDAAGAPTSQTQLTQGGPTQGASQKTQVLVSPNETRPSNVYVNYIIKFTNGLMPAAGHPMFHQTR